MNNLEKLATRRDYQNMNNLEKLATRRDYQNMNNLEKLATRRGKIQRFIINMACHHVSIVVYKPINNKIGFPLSHLLLIIQGYDH
jgi:hypothetical protein